MQLTTIQQARIERDRKTIVAQIERQRTDTINKLVAKYAATKQQKEKAQ